MGGRNYMGNKKFILGSNSNYIDVDSPKDCKDFVPLNDGTILGDKKYCNLSKQCKQIDMYSEYVECYEFYLDSDGILNKRSVREYLCTGKRPLFEERSKDEKAS